jgi:hypothetical protein
MTNDAPAKRPVQPHLGLHFYSSSGMTVEHCYPLLPTSTGGREEDEGPQQ